MSEDNRGGIGIEALVTVCCAMSQLDVYVASFGKQGNITLLHNFDQSFPAEAGIMNILGTDVVHARLPTEYDPLMQLVLIKGHGLFTEKEGLSLFNTQMSNDKE